MTVSLDFNSRGEVSPAINKEIARYSFGHKKQENRPYLGASYIGKECDRAIYYQALQFERDVPTNEEEFLDSARMERILWRGNVCEDYIADLLTFAGIGLQTISAEKNDLGEIGGQIEVVYNPHPEDNDSYPCKGHLDGIVVEALNIPELEPYLPGVWENKVVNEKSYNALKKATIRSWKPVYYAQVQFYMGRLGLKHTLFSVMNANTMELQFHIVDFSPEYYASLLKKIDSILMYIKNGVVPPRVPKEGRKSSKGNFSPCTYCDFKTVCEG